MNFNELPEGMEKIMNIDKNELLDYESIKDRLIIKICGIEDNSEKLKMMPYTEIEDMAITYQCLISDDNKMNSTTALVITNDLLDFYGISKEQLHEDAMKSAVKLMPVNIKSIKEVLTDMIDSDVENIDAMTENGLENFMTIVSNDKYINGASAIFYPGVMDMLAERIGHNYFILPSSKHELIVIPETPSESYHDLQAMVSEINRESVPESDRLSDKVYHYDIEERVFELAEKYDERIHEKMNVVVADADKGRNSIMNKLNKHMNKSKELATQTVNRSDKARENDMVR